MTEKAKKLQVYNSCETRSGEDFYKQLAEKFPRYRKETKKTASDVSAEAPLVVIVQNYSRIATDIDRELEKLPELTGKNAAIVVFHVTAKHALPEEMQTKQLTDEKHTKHACLVDFYYTPDDGIYTCRLNGKAVDMLNEFLKQRVKKTSKGNCCLSCVN